MSVLPPPLPVPAPVPRWLAALFFGLLVLPFHPQWIDFEQVRRGQLLVLTGLALVLLPRLPAVRGERALLALLLWFTASAAIVWLGQLFLRGKDQPLSFQPWEAILRLGHWLSLWVAVRLGAACRATTALPLAILLLLTAGFGLLQRLGLGEIAGYGVPREPVSVFGNRNVASEWTAVGAMLVAVLLPQLGTARTRAIGLTALALAGAYLVANQSRSGLIALPIGLLLLLVLQRRRALLPIGAVAGGMLLGLVLATAAARPMAENQLAARAELQRSTSTLAVRFEIAKSTTRLFAESPVFGHGPGQFAVQYPRHRSQAEIEASSFGRQFATEVRTAHDDWLELLVDGGLPALALFAAALFALQRQQADKARLLPLFVLLLLMLVRAPLWNAPAAAAAVWLAGDSVAAAAAPARRRWVRPLAVLLGLCLVVLGVLPIVGNSAMIAHQAALRAGDQPPAAAAISAAWWMPYEPRWQQLMAQEARRTGDLASARRAAARAVALRPFDPQAYELLVDVLIRGQAFAEARSLVRHALTLDPVHPELRLWQSWLAMRAGDADAAIAAVVQDPHPTLRAQLGAHFDALRKNCRDERLAARFAIEHHFTSAVDRLGAEDQETRDAIMAHIQQLTVAMRIAEQSDARPLVLGALLVPEDAASYAKGARKFGPLLPWQKALLGDRLAPLRRFEAWLPIVGER
jgi:O-antigen ligase